MSFNELQFIKNQIDNMDIINQKEILNIFKENNINITENNNGSFINLSSINKEILDKIKLYIEYFNIQQNNLTIIEDEKNNIKNEFFSKNNKKSEKNKIIEKNL